MINDDELPCIETKHIAFLYYFVLINPYQCYADEFINYDCHYCFNQLLMKRIYDLQKHLPPEILSCLYSNVSIHNK